MTTDALHHPAPALQNLIDSVGLRPLLDKAMATDNIKLRINLAQALIEAGTREGGAPQLLIERGGRIGHTIARPRLGHHGDALQSAADAALRIRPGNPLPCIQPPGQR